MKITGRINEWNLLTGTFKVYTPAGDFEIATEKLEEPMVDALIDAMKNRRDITISDSEGAPDPARLDFPGYGKGADLFEKWTVVKDEYDPAARIFRLRIRDNRDQRIGYSEVKVPDNPIQLSRCYIETTLLYWDLIERALELIAPDGDSPTRTTKDAEKEMALRKIILEHTEIGKRRRI